MSHLHGGRPEPVARVRRLRGQIEAIERALEAGAPCGEVPNLAASVRGAFGGLFAELAADHIRNHVCDPATEPDPARAEGTRELVAIIGRYLR